MPKGVPLDLSSGTKHCPRCQQTFPLAAFSKSKRNVSGYQSYCKACMYERLKEWSALPGKKAHLAARLREQRAKDPERFRDYDLRSTRGVPPGTYQRMYEEQQGKCAICQTSKLQAGKYRLHLDHCHETGIIRGLLCHNCNVGIGNLRHDEKIIRAAIDYLNRTSKKTLK